MGIYGGDEYVALTQLPCVIFSREQSRGGTGTGTGSVITVKSPELVLLLLLLLLALSILLPFRVPVLTDDMDDFVSKEWKGEGSFDEV